MKNLTALTFLTLLTASQISFALTDLPGDWCQIASDDSSDSRIVMTILANGDFMRDSTDQESSEKDAYVEGSLNVGASNASMDSAGITVLLHNVEVKTDWLTRKETLHIEYTDKKEEVFNRCEIVWTVFNGNYYRFK